MKSAAIDRARLDEILSEPTVSVPVAGSLFGLGNDAAYRAATAGTLPGVITIGRNKRVSSAVLRRVLGLDAASAA
jgi:hypothetical protein